VAAGAVDAINHRYCKGTECGQFRAHGVKLFNPWLANDADQVPFFVELHLALKLQDGEQRGHEANEMLGRKG